MSPMVDGIEQRYYVTERSPRFEEVVTTWRQDGEGESLDYWWNIVRHEVWHPNEHESVGEPLKRRKVKESVNEPSFYDGIIKKPRVGKPWYGWDLSTMGMAPLDNFTSPLEPLDEHLTDYRVSADDDTIIDRFKPIERPQPVNFILTGTRGTHKSAVTAAIGHTYCTKFEQRKHIKPRGQRQRVISNYYIKSVMDVGPVAFERQNVGRAHEHLVPIHPVDIDHPITIPAQRPAWSNDCEIMIDEFADYASNLRSTAREARDFGAWGRQIRKQGTEMWVNTQFFEQLPGGSVGVQLDVFARLEYSKGRNEVDVMCWDWWGQFTKSNKHRRKGMNFIDLNYDWAFTISNISAVYPLYNTDQVIPPAWYPQSDRRQILDNQRQSTEVWQ